jgi:uncharacterized repeat protein (TIGR01451 family)
MQNLLVFQDRSLLTVAFLICATVTSACAQEKPKRMIPGPSVKELIPESTNEKEDGISRITIGQLFKPGTTEYAAVGAKGLRDAPPLPTGYVLFKDLVYKVRTEAITSGYQLTVFSLPSVENETDFSKLNILHLEDDEMSPSGFSWNPVTVLSGDWEEHYHFVSKEKYEALVPDFKSKRITAITHEFGVFLVALAPASISTSNGPFTQMEIIPTSSPEPIIGGEEVTHSIVVRNKGPNSTAEVNIKEELNPELTFVSATSNQGNCKQSNESSGRVLCHLGAMPSGVLVTITVVARVRDNPLIQTGSKAGNELEINFKKNPTDFVEADNQMFMNFTTTIVKKQ